MSYSSRSRILGPLSLVAALSATASAQTTWYVDVNAVPPGNGTQAQPYTAIQYAIAQPTTVHGDTLLVAPGEYVENVSVNKRLTLRSSGGPLVTTIRPAQWDNTVIIWFDTTFEGFTVAGDTPPGFAASIYVRNAEGKIRRCIVRDNTTSNGILSAYDAYVYNCTVTGNAIGVQSTNFGGMASLESCIVNFNATNFVEQPGGALSYGSGVYGAPDPGFWNYAERDLRLRPGSMAIDAGYVNAPHDPDGSVTDAGALTYDPTYAPGPSSYCVGKLNSQGCTPAIGAIGSASATSGGPFVVTAVNGIANKPCVMLFSQSKAATPFQGATLCVGAPIKRLGNQISAGSGNCGGTSAFDMQAHIQGGTQPSLIPGALGYCQWWSRDIFDPAGFGTSLTDALYFGIAP